MTRGPGRRIPSAPSPSRRFTRAAPVDLQLADPAYRTLTPGAAPGRAAIEEAARAVEGGGWHPLRHHRLRRHALGDVPGDLERVRGRAGRHSFWLSAASACRTRRPAAGGIRFRRRGSSPSCRRRPSSGGRRPSARSPASARGRSVGGHDPGPRQPRGGAVRGRPARGPLAAAALQQQRSFLEGKLGQAIGSPLLDVADDPLIPRGSARASSTARASPRRSGPVFEKGVLRNYYVDTYYGRKLKMAPTTGGASNLAWTLGPKPQAALVGTSARASS